MNEEEIKRKQESMYFCNEWQCEFRCNNIHKNEMLCDRVWNDECPYDDEFYESLRR